MDEDAYYSKQGATLERTEAANIEATYSGYLQLTGPLVDLAGGVVRTESAASIKIEGATAFADAMQGHVGDVLALDEGNPNKHLLLDAFQRRLVHNALALGRALRRKVIMPRMTCWCDRYWWLLEDCRFPGVTREQQPLPFHCPFDHLFDLEKWVHSEVRGYGFSLSSAIIELLMPAFWW